MQLNPYLNFDGNGKEALAYYADVFDGEVLVAMTFGEMPGEHAFVNDSNRDRLAHGTVRFGDRVLFASDTGGQAPHKGFEGVTLQLSFDTVEEGQAIFDRLAAEGSVTMPFAPTFWAKGFGMLRDKFGVAVDGELRRARLVVATGLASAARSTPHRCG